ncbi:unnamed protein product [Peniophora sp. CBMAI 1063]|nr:unnamed protein product [Peniophora sp. CBMAI 1063]
MRNAVLRGVGLLNNTEDTNSMSTKSSGLTRTPPRLGRSRELMAWCMDAFWSEDVVEAGSSWRRDGSTREEGYTLRLLSSRIKTRRVGISHVVPDLSAAKAVTKDAGAIHHRLASLGGLRWAAHEKKPTVRCLESIASPVARSIQHLDVALR